MGVPIIRTMVFWGLYWGLFVLGGNYQLGFRVEEFGDLGFRGLGFRGLGFGGLGSRGLGVEGSCGPGL